MHSDNDIPEPGEHTEVMGAQAGGKTPVEEVATGPVPLVQGTFAIFMTNKKMVLAMHTDKTGDRQIEVPKFMVSQAMRADPMLRSLLSDQ